MRSAHIGTTTVAGMMDYFRTTEDAKIYTVRCIVECLKNSGAGFVANVMGCLLMSSPDRHVVPELGGFYLC